VALGGALFQDAQPRGRRPSPAASALERPGAKPAREIKPGDELDIVAGETALDRDRARPQRAASAGARGAPALRGNAGKRARRQQQEEIRRLAPMPGAGLKGRPTKKAGRLIRGFNE
jgi:ribosome-associated heat shock protein Hsp15